MTPLYFNEQYLYVQENMNITCKLIASINCKMQIIWREINKNNYYCLKMNLKTTVRQS